MQVGKSIKDRANYAIVGRHDVLEAIADKVEDMYQDWLSGGGDW